MRFFKKGTVELTPVFEEIFSPPFRVDVRPRPRTEESESYEEAIED